jgi:hypothetical protein
MEAESPDFALAMEGMSIVLEPATRVRTKSRRLLLVYTPSCVCFWMGLCGATKQDAECRVIAAISRNWIGVERVMILVIEVT